MQLFLKFVFILNIFHSHWASLAAIYEGNIYMQRRQHMKDKKYERIFFLISAPTNWLNIFMGFKVSSILPSGWGSIGLWLGLSRALPQGFLSATSAGRTSIWTFTLPRFFNSPFVGSLRSKFSQKRFGSFSSNSNF